MKRITLILSVFLVAALICSCVAAQTSVDTTTEKKVDVSGGTETTAPPDNDTDDPGKVGAETAEKTVSVSSGKDLALTKGTLRIYLSTSKGSDLVLTAEVRDHTGVKNNDEIVSAVSGYGLTIGKKVVAEPVFRSYEIIKSKDADKNVHYFIALTGDQATPGKSAVTNVYDRGGNLVGEYTGFTKLFSDQYGDYHTFVTDSEKDPVYGCAGVLDPMMNILIPAEYQSIRYAGYGAIAEDEHALILDKLKDDGKTVETYTAAISGDGPVLYGPYPRFSVEQADALKITNDDGTVEYMIGGKIYRLSE